MRVYHEFEPIFNNQSKILVLGSFPSVKSREQHFYYGHPQNRFWKVLSKVLACEEPITIEDKKKMLLEHEIALWDVIESCEIVGSSDASIKEVIPNRIEEVLEHSSVKVIFCNGKTAYNLYKKYFKHLSIEVICLPSTSAANAAYRLDRLIEQWKVIKNYEK